MTAQDKELVIFFDVEQENAVKRGDGPLLYGRGPSEERDPMDTTLYDDLGVPLAFTGGLLLTSGFIRELYVHMGFHPAWKCARFTRRPSTPDG